MQRMGTQVTVGAATVPGAVVGAAMVTRAMDPGGMVIPVMDTGVMEGMDTGVVLDNGVMPGAAPVSSSRPGAC